MESRNEVERDWNSAALIDGLARGAKYFYVDENGDRHEFYRAANGEITVNGNVTFNGKKQQYCNQGDIVMASVFKKEIFEKIKRVEGVYSLPDRDEELFEKMNKMAERIHQQVEDKQKQGIEFAEAWDIVTEDLATEIISGRKNADKPNVREESSDDFLSNLQSKVNIEPTAFEATIGDGSEQSITTPKEV